MSPLDQSASSLSEPLAYGREVDVHHGRGIRRLASTAPRHTHKTWLIEDGIPEIVQARRLGHRLGGVRGIYSHVTPAVRQRLVQALQHRWESTQPAPPSQDHGTAMDDEQAA
jgi:hypothetical protein